MNGRKALCVLNTMVHVSRKNIEHKPSYDYVYALGLIDSFFGS